MRNTILLLILLLAGASASAQAVARYEVVKTQTDTSYIVSIEENEFLNGIKTRYEVWTPVVGKQALKEQLSILQLVKESERAKLLTQSIETDSVAAKIKRIKKDVDKKSAGQ